MEGKNRCPDFLSPSHIGSTIASAREEKSLATSSHRSRDLQEASGGSPALHPLTLGEHPTPAVQEQPGARSAGWHRAPAPALLGSMSHHTQAPPPNAMPAMLSHAGKGRVSTRILSASHRAHAGPTLLAGSCTYALSPWQDAPLDPAKFKPAVQHPPGTAELRAFGRRNLASAQTHVAGGCLPWLTRLAVGGHQVPLVINLSPGGNAPTEASWRHGQVHGQLQDAAAGWICTVEGAQPTLTRDTTRAGENQRAGAGKHPRGLPRQSAPCGSPTLETTRLHPLITRRAWAKQLARARGECIFSGWEGSIPPPSLRARGRAKLAPGPRTGISMA